ncbi:MAG: hypothetical protein RLZ98_1409 [Pseudomonadota bacterium]|jgi:pyruvate dehydrogenase E2 component (dihydrolipoamide acetyltransferase)
MPINILMPALSPTMEEGKLARWLVKEGDGVKSGDVIAEIETDKATMEVEAIDEGRVAKLLVAEGTEGVKVNQLIAVLAEEGEDMSAAAAGAKAPAAGAPAQAPVPEMAAGPAGQGASTGTSRGNGHANKTVSGGGRIFASPLARRLAKTQGLDIARISGSGPHGRVVKSDVEAAAKTGQGGTAVATTSGALERAGMSVEAMPDKQIMALYEQGTFDVVPHDGMRRIIAQRLTQSKQTVPHFYLNIDCRLDQLLQARERINAAAPKEGPRAFKLSVNDFIIKALALALQQVPGANATWTEQGMLRHRHSDVGVAVAIEGGLFTPVIRHAELKTLGEISNEMKDLAARARNRRLAPHEYQGGTTSISNLGMYGIESFDAVINPPHATILAVGAGQKKPIVVDDTIEVATVMACTLSCDHRVVDGALGAQLLNAFKALIEDPVRMLV